MIFLSFFFKFYLLWLQWVFVASYWLLGLLFIVGSGRLIVVASLVVEHRL